jgi:cytochrome P450
MVLNPEVQKKAQEEMEAQGYSTSTDRLPSFQQRGLFPYVTAIVKEVLRWAPPVPLGT